MPPTAPTPQQHAEARLHAEAARLGFEGTRYIDFCVEHIFKPLSEPTAKRLYGWIKNGQIKDIHVQRLPWPLPADLPLSDLTDMDRNELVHDTVVNGAQVFMNKDYPSWIPYRGLSTKTFFENSCLKVLKDVWPVARWREISIWATKVDLPSSLDSYLSARGIADSPRHDTSGMDELLARVTDVPFGIDIARALSAGDTPAQIRHDLGITDNTYRSSKAKIRRRLDPGGSK